MSGRFRQDVEGLRAIAILPILAFHLDPKLCPGGFIGVDIFFVISGALISRMILDQGASFSFANFYMRRVLRLAPALLVTLLVTMLAGWRYLGPAEFTALARATFAAALGVSNFYFFLTFDYFQPAGTSQPLLHTWSLSLEEQVYLVWPLLLTFAARRGAVLWAIAGAGVASIVLVIAVQGAIPQAVFYLMPFRLFEFAIGAAVVLADPLIVMLSALARAVLGTIAVLVLGASFIFFDGSTPWPSMATVPPAVATAALLIAGPASVWGRLLALAPLRLMGRISYSVYLVHWPLVVFYRAHTITDASPLELLALFAVTIALGTALHVFVETPFRQTGANVTALPNWAQLLAFSPKVQLAGTFMLLLALATVAFATVATNGFPGRLDRARVQMLDKGLSYAGDVCDQRYARCTFGSKTADRVIYLVGDSHALNLVHGLDALLQEWNIRGVALYDHGCLFAYGSKRFIDGVSDQKCMQNVRRAYDFLAGTSDPVIIAGNYPGYQNAIGYADAQVPLRHDKNEYFAWVQDRMLEGLRLLKPETRTIIMVRQTYNSGISLPSCLSQPGVDASNADKKCPAMTRTQIREYNAQTDKMIGAIAQAIPSIEVWDPVDAFCQAERCTVFGPDGALYLRDSDHLTNEGSLFLLSHMREGLKAALDRAQP